MALRDINDNLKNWLLEGTSFHYAHLVKFEKPVKTSSSVSARNATDYVYITDGSLDISFNDGSVNSEGVSNGTQTYRANKLLSVGGISETIEARATSMNLQVSSGALNIELEDTFNITASSLEGSEDLVAAGFREGDTVILTQSGANNNKEVRIDKFENSNKKAIVTPLTALSIGSESLTLKFKNPEVEGMLLDRGDSSYARYINRDVFVYKAHINPETGTIIGTPYLIFKGIIAGGKLTEDPSKSSMVSWTLTSHWGDFSRVQGRLTSDAYHRALDENNLPDPEATIRPEYAADLGFLHSEQAINLVAIYQVMETKYRMKKKSSFFGLKKSYSMEEYQVQVDREADLRFNLEARYLPVVYGVNKIDSIPVFVDTLNTDSKKVFVAYALCEGQIAGLYDIYFDDTSSICIDENDSETRSSQTSENTIDVLCQGRGDRGDTLTGNDVNSSTAITYDGSLFSWGSETWNSEELREAFAVDGIGWVPLAFRDTPGGASSFGAGITHEKGTRFETPINTRLQFHAGKPNQAVSPIIASNANNFKVATDYYSGNDPYWGANHRLLDTAYVVAEYEIGEGETTIPSLEFVVRGKGIDCFNYDFSYAQDPAFASGENPSVFNIGDSVQLRKVSPDALIRTVTIADIYSLVNIDGTTENRIRFTEDPGLGNTTNFYITAGGNRVTLVTYDHVATEGQVPSELKEEITSVAPSSTQGVDLTLEPINAAVAAALENGSIFGISSTSDISELRRELLNYWASTYSAGTLEGVGTTTTNSSELETKYVVVLDGIKLASAASSVDDTYNNYEIELTHYNSDGTTRVQKRIIIDYDGATQVATVDAPWTLPPNQNDKYKIFSTTDDVRVSTNPALQTLDYLRSERYGRNLDLTQDLDKESFLEAARACDFRSNVTMVTTAAPSIGDIYEFKPSSTRFFQGTVKTVTSVTIDSSTRYVVEFEEVLGKLGIRWENWKYFYAGELLYNNGTVRSAISDDEISVFDSNKSTPVTSLVLNQRTGSGPSSLSVDITSSTFDGNPIVKSYTPASKSYSSGYSLYDSDDVKYWRYLGWEAQNQRHVTRHQTNSVVDTSRSIFDNINGLLGHFNGMLRYSAGKYSLAVKTQAGARTDVDVDGTTYTVDKITEDDIIGSINIEDAGQKGTYNQVDVTINDPQNRFEGRSVMMFNSNYLKEDRMIPKKGSVRTPYVTNYYNARINAKQYLEESRAGLKVNFTIAPKGVLLRAGDIIQIEYSRFGWYSNSQKYFRIINLNISDNCLIQITAEEHSEEAFLITAKNRGQISPVEGTTAAPAAPTPPTGLSATQTSESNVKTGAIQLTWENSTTFKAASYSTQIWGGTENDRDEAVLLGTTKAQRYIDAIPDQGLLNKYYWVRHVVTVPPQTGSQVGFKEIFSAYERSNPVDGVLGTIDDGRNIVLDIDNDAATVGGIEGENVTNFSESVTATVFAGSADDTSNWNLTWTASTVGTDGTSVAGSVSGDDDETYTVTGLNNGANDEEFTFADIVVTATRDGYTTRQKRFTITKILNGQNGVVYKIIPSANVVRFDPNIGTGGAYEGGTGDSNNQVNFSFVKIQNGESSAFSGRYSLNGGDITPGVGEGTATQTTFTALVNGDTENITCLLYNEDGELFDRSEVPLVKQGLSSRQLIISTSAQNFIKAKNGDFSPASIALTAKKLGGITGTVAWTGTTFYGSAALTTAVTEGDIVYIAPSSVASGNVTITASVTDSLTTLNFSDSEEIGLLEEGSDTISMSLTNDSVEIPTDSSGTSPDFGNTSTNISVYEGSTALTYDDDNTKSDSQLSNSTFTLEIVTSGVTAPPPSGYDETIATSPASGTITAITGNQGSITFIARAKRANGTVVTGVSKVQTFSKIKAGAAGADGADGATGADGADGADGAAGADGLTGFLYYFSEDTSTDKDHITAINVETGQIAIVQNTAGTQAGYRYNGSDWVSQTIVNSDIIFADAIGAQQLQISSTTGGPGQTGIYMNSSGTNNQIEIWESGNKRVVLGKLV